MKQFKVFYMKRLPSNTRKMDITCIDGTLPTLEEFNEYYVYLQDVFAKNENEVYHIMQGDIWSPNGEAKDLIISKGLSHTSMSIGDIVYDILEDTYKLCARIGFVDLPYTEKAVKKISTLEKVIDNIQTCETISEKLISDCKNKIHIEKITNVIGEKYIISFAKGNEIKQNIEIDEDVFISLNRGLQSRYAYNTSMKLLGTLKNIYNSTQDRNIKNIIENDIESLIINLALSKRKG